MPSGALPAWIVRLTVFVAGSTTEIVFASMFGTHRAPSTQALARGFAPTATEPTTFRLTGSSRNTRPRSLETHSAPPPGVIQSAAGTAMGNGTWGIALYDDVSAYLPLRLFATLLYYVSEFVGQ